MSKQTVHVSGGAYVLVPKAEYDALQTLANMPALPQPGADGNYPAKEFLRASIARDIITERVKVGLSQRALAKLAGIRVETLCRIETGKHTPTVQSIEKIDLALKQAEARQAKPRKRPPKKQANPKANTKSPTRG
jgi:DNA-binding XRE family transcriptional regulator